MPAARMDRLRVFIPPVDPPFHPRSTPKSVPLNSGCLHPPQVAMAKSRPEVATPREDQFCLKSAGDAGGLSDRGGIPRHSGGVLRDRRLTSPFFSRRSRPGPAQASPPVEGFFDRRGQPDLRKMIRIKPGGSCFRAAPQVGVAEHDVRGLISPPRGPFGPAAMPLSSFSGFDGGQATPPSALRGPFDAAAIPRSDARQGPGSRGGGNQERSQGWRAAGVPWPRAFRI
jgi:hypothetical protein